MTTSPKRPSQAEAAVRTLIEWASDETDPKDDLARTVEEILAPKGVGVVIISEHSCMTMRGVNTPGSRLTTSHLLGEVRDDARTRQEFFDLVRD